MLYCCLYSTYVCVVLLFVFHLCVVLLFVFHLCVVMLFVRTCSWHPKVMNLFLDKKLVGGVPVESEDSFYNSSCTLIGNLVRGMLTRAVEDFVEQFSCGRVALLPVFLLQLCYKGDRLVFEPSLQEVEDSVVFVVQQISNTLQSIPHLKVRVCVCVVCVRVCLVFVYFVYVRMCVFCVCVWGGGGRVCVNA